MTQDVDIILKGLHCCSRVNPDCDNCPFYGGVKYHGDGVDSASWAITKVAKQIEKIENNSEKH